MAILWSEALHRTYPPQAPHYRPSGIASCGLKQAAGVGGIKPTNTEYSGIWQMELGRAGQSIALQAFPYLGFYLKETIKLDDGPIPGEADFIVNVLPHNVLGIPVGEYIGEVKLRNTFAYNHVWMTDDMMSPVQVTKNIVSDLASEGVQVNTYMGMRGLSRALILLLPFDSSSVRNDMRFSKGSEINHDPYIRVFTTDFNPEVYLITLQRKEVLEKYGTKVAPEYDPNAGQFPCTYCDWMDWCRSRGPAGEEMPQYPKYGMPLVEWSVA